MDCEGFHWKRGFIWAFVITSIWAYSKTEVLSIEEVIINTVVAALIAGGLLWIWMPLHGGLWHSEHARRECPGLKR